MSSFFSWCRSIWGELFYSLSILLLMSFPILYISYSASTTSNKVKPIILKYSRLGKQLYSSKMRFFFRSLYLQIGPFMDCCFHCLVSSRIDKSLHIRPYEGTITVLCQTIIENLDNLIEIVMLVNYSLDIYLFSCNLTQCW